VSKIHVDCILAVSHVHSSFTQAIVFSSPDTYPLSKENPWFYCWITAAIFSSCYAYTWDIKMDWGLFDSKAGDNRFLREEIVYSSTVSPVGWSLVFFFSYLE